MSVVYQLFCLSHTLVGFVHSGKCIHVLAIIQRWHEGAVLFIHRSTLAWCKFRLKKSLSIVVLLLGNSLLHNGCLVNSIEHACVLITLIPTDYTCITHLQTELLLHACKSRFYKESRSVTEIRMKLKSGIIHCLSSAIIIR